MKIKPIVFSAAFSLALVAAIITVPHAFAESGSGSGSGSRDLQSSTTVTTQTNTSTSSSNETETSHSTNTSVEQENESPKTTQEDSNRAHEEAEGRMERKKAEVKVKLDAKRLEVCEKHQQRVNALTAKLAAQGTGQLTVFQTIKNRVIAFKQQKNLQPVGYDALVADANAKEQSTLAAVENLKVAQLDCNSEGTNRQVGSYVSTTAHSLRNALQAYRVSVKNLIVAVKQASGVDATPQSDSEKRTTTNTTSVNAQNAAGER